MDKDFNKKTDSCDLILGIDDAGRGPVLGSMFLAGALMTGENEKFLKSQDVKDSKLLSHNKRIRLAKLIKEKSVYYKVVGSTPQEIDNSIRSGTNLNTLEAKKAASIINSLNNKKGRIWVIIDCPSVNTSAWKDNLLEFVENPENLKITCEHKADFKYPAVSAASILAKVAREDNIMKIKERIKADFGSGYPADPITQKFLKERGHKFLKYGIIRQTWQTWKNLVGEKGQKKLF